MTEKPSSNCRRGRLSTAQCCALRRRLERVEAQLRIYSVVLAMVAFTALIVVMLLLHDLLDPLAVFPWDDDL